jgi:hypothetical protein
MAVVDAAVMLIPAGQIPTSQDFPALQVQPRFLPTYAWVISVLIPPVASCTFTLAVSTTQNGTFTTIATFPWPAGVVGSRQVRVGAGGNAAQLLAQASAWLRASVQTTGSLTVAGSWLSKASDGGPGLGSRSYSLDSINAF